jgi:hypothetical protein
VVEDGGHEEGDCLLRLKTVLLPRQLLRDMFQQRGIDRNLYRGVARHAVLQRKGRRRQISIVCGGLQARGSGYLSGGLGYAVEKYAVYAPQIG